MIEADVGTRLADLGQGPSWFSETIWSVLAAQPELRDSFPLVLALPQQDDPWYVAYLAAFGAFPPGPSADALLHAGLRPGIEIDDLVRVERGEVEAPSGDDLLARLREPARWYPRRLSLYGLGASSAAWSQDLILEQLDVACPPENVATSVDVNDGRIGACMSSGAAMARHGGPSVSAMVSRRSSATLSDVIAHGRPMPCRRRA